MCVDSGLIFAPYNILYTQTGTHVVCVCAVRRGRDAPINIGRGKTCVSPHRPRAHSVDVMKLARNCKTRVKSSPRSRKPPPETIDLNGNNIPHPLKAGATTKTLSIPRRLPLFNNDPARLCAHGCAHTHTHTMRAPHIAAHGASVRVPYAHM